MKAKTMPEDQTQPEDNVLIQLYDQDGNLKEEQTTHNLVTTAGKNAIASRLASSPGSAVPTHMAIGTGTTAANAADTTLVTEIDRNALTSNTATTNVLTMVGNWAAGDGTGAITEAGVLSAASGGTLFVRAVFSVINKAAGDTLAITWALTVS